MREVAVIGVGSTVFGKFPERLVKDMGSDAVWAAVEDAGISPKDIQVAYAATSFGATSRPATVPTALSVSFVWFCRTIKPWWPLPAVRPT